MPKKLLKKKLKKSKGKIKSISLKNFQGHTDSKITLDPNVTALVGESDAGKSSIIRAIKWVTTNRPLGSVFKNYNATNRNPFSTHLKFDDGTKVGLDKKTYTINEKEITKFGTTVPYEVEDTIALNDLNIQSQHDKYFLLQDTSGNVARKLNELVNLDIIDSVLKDVNSDIRSSNKETEEFKIKVSNTKDAINVFKRLPHVEKLVSSLESRIDVCDANRDILDTVQSIYTSIMLNKSKIKNIDEWLTIEDSVKEIMELFTIRTKAKEDLIFVETSIETIYAYQEKIKLYEHTITAESKVKKILDASKIHDILLKEINGVSGLLFNLEHNLEGLSALENEIEDKKQKLITILLSAKICPFCGCKTTKENIRKHVEEMT
jgi:DNA repair protein SbcC/Rad50